MFKQLIRKIAFRTGRFANLYVKFCRPAGADYALFQQKWGRYYSIGDNCSIYPWTNVANPEYTRLGNNVRLSACTVLGHDGSVAVLNRAYGKRLDKVGKVDIKDNVFVGHGAIILPNVTIGPNAIVAAGAVVNSDVPEGTIVGGVPAKVIGLVDDLVERLEKQTEALPWADIIKNREGAFDPKVEPKLKAMRAKYFFGEDS